MRFLSHLVPAAVAAYILVASGTASASPPSYGGGAVIPNPLVVPVFWGSTVNSTVKSTMGPFFRALMTNNYLDWLDEYYSASPQIGPIGRGACWGDGSSVTINPTNPNTILDEVDIARELAKQINNNVLPAPDGRTIYIIYFPKGFNLHIGFEQSCTADAVSFCGAHTEGTQVIGSQSVTFPFAVIPDQSPGSGCDTACGSGTMIQNVTAISGHEIAEVMTDPDIGSGWSDAGPIGITEIGDICQNKYSTITASNGTKYTVQKLWSNANGKCISSDLTRLCQRTSDAFGVSANVTWGFAPSDVRSWWTASNCNTFPNPQLSSDLCQKASEIYGIEANVTFGYAPTSVQQWWIANLCDTAPIESESLCDRAADTFGIVDFVTFGNAPSSVRSWWRSNNCHSVPHGLDACQRAADLYGIVANNTWGFAPLDVQSWWSSNNCDAATSSSQAQLCQNASNLFAIVPFLSWGGAPDEVQAWWTSQSCDDVVPAGPQCQGVSELFGTSAGVTWGYAPSYIEDWWIIAGCFTQPLFIAGPCQRAADTFGIVANYTFGFAPASVATWWQDIGCDTHPHSDASRVFTNGP